MTEETKLPNSLRRELKARAQHLEPCIKLGHAGASDALIKSLDTALLIHELVKIKFTDFKDQKHTLAPQIATRTASTLIMQVGNVAVFYKPRTTPQPD